MWIYFNYDDRISRQGWVYLFSWNPSAKSIGLFSCSSSSTRRSPSVGFAVPALDSQLILPYDCYLMIQIFDDKIYMEEQAAKWEHIFLKAQVASNKNAHKLRHHFWAQFFMLFHMMWSILLRVLALKTLKWKFLIGCWRTSTNEKVVSRPNTPNKMNHTMWKSMKNCVPKLCCKLCTSLFKVTCPFWKMWYWMLRVF